MRESLRMAEVQSPIIPVVGELIRKHPGTISLGQGVVNYGPPPEAEENMRAFFDDPANHKYQMVQGIPPLLEGLQQKLREENGIPPANGTRLMVTAGGNMAFMNAVLAITDPGDEIIIQTPYYFNHEMAVAIAGCRAVCVETDENYQLRPAAIRDAITPKTRAIVTISPNNPTGAVYPRESLEAVNQLCLGAGLYHINDEAYEYFTYDDAEHFSPASIPSSEEHTISLFSLSKAYGFASWRIGYMLFPEHLYMAVRKIQDTILICPPVLSQWAAVGALKAGAAYCRQGLRIIAENRRIALRELAAIGDIVDVPPAGGAFYLLLRVNTTMDSMKLVERLIEDFGVAVIPGSTFGITSGCYLRLAYGALENETAAEGIGRLVTGLRSIVGSGSQ